MFCSLATVITVAAGPTVLNPDKEGKAMSNDTSRQGHTGAAGSRSIPDTDTREAYITGKPPRIPPLTSDQIGDMGEDALVTVGNLRKALGLPPTGLLPDFIATMLRHPDLYQCHIALGYFLFKGALTTRDRELAILRTGWLCQAPYEWGEHVKVGKNLAGLTNEEITRVTVGSTADGWSEYDRALLRAVEELHADAMISDETWAVLARNLDDKQLIELPVLVGQYMGVAFLQNSLRVQLMAGNAGLSAG